MAHTHTHDPHQTHFPLQKYEIRLFFCYISCNFSTPPLFVLLGYITVTGSSYHPEACRHKSSLSYPHFLFYAFFEQFPMKSHLFWQLKKNVWKEEKTKDERWTGEKRKEQMDEGRKGYVDDAPQTGAAAMISSNEWKWDQTESQTVFS